MGYPFEGLDKLLFGLLTICAVSVPLGLWKLVEIGLWVWRHVHFGVRP